MSDAQLIALYALSGCLLSASVFCTMSIFRLMRQAEAAKTRLIVALNTLQQAPARPDGWSHRVGLARRDIQEAIELLGK